MAKEKESKKESKEENKEMSLQEAKEWRASLYKPEDKALSEREKKELFRVFWASEKRKYGKGKDLEEIIWLHLKTMKMDNPDKFEAGLAHFGLKKLGN